MQLLPPRLLCYTILLITGGLIFLNIDSLGSQSVDLAHHYALAFRISEQFHLMSSNDPTLGEMNYYPRLSHIFAAIIGWPLNSTFLGLQIVSLLSLAGIWGGFVYILNTLPRAIASLSTLALVMLLVLNKLLLKLDVHGAEITGNYFYSQLVGQAIVIISIAVAISLEARKGRATAYAFLIGVIVINTGVHLLPTLELLGMLGALVAFNGYLDFTEKKVKAPWALATLVIPVIGLCGIILNPAFSAMRKISENDGALNFSHISYPIGIALLCLMGMAVSVGLLYIYTKNKQAPGYSAIKYIALYGAATCGLCLLQMVLVKFGLGSNYAVKKYGFSIISYLIVSFAVLLGLASYRSNPERIRFLYNNSTLYLLMAAASFYCIYNASIIPREHHDLSDLVQLERKLSAAVSQLPFAESEKNNVVIGLDGMPPTFNYLFSIALAKTPRDLAIPDVLIANSLRDYTRYANVISSTGVRKYDITQCEVRSEAGIATSNAECLADQLSNSNDCQGRVDFSIKGLVDPRRLKGFSSSETEGTWMVGDRAEFSCNAVSQALRTLTIDMRPFTTSQHSSQRIQILINGIERYNSTWTGASDAIAELTLPPIENGKIVVTFITPDAASPQQLNMSEDARLLSFYVKSMSFK